MVGKRTSSWHQVTNGILRQAKKIYYCDTHHSQFLAGISSKVNTLLARIECHEIWLWSLIDIQHELEALIKVMAQHSPSEWDEQLQLLQSLVNVVGQYETQAWQFVPIQMRLRVKLVEVANASASAEATVIGQSSIVQQEPVKAIETVRFSSDDEQFELDERPQRRRRSSSPPPSPNEPETFACPYCDKSFGTAKGLRSHSVFHKEVRRPFACTECDKSYNTKVCLVEHQRVHSGEKRHKCRYCDERFETSNRLKSHTAKHIAAGDVRLDFDICRICRYVFASRKLLFVHLRDCHDGARPYACDQCGIDFANNARLARHEIVKHGMERPFVCDICQKRFIDKCNLRAHMDTHRDCQVPCTICNKMLQSVHSLKVHMKMAHLADGETRYRFLCAECGKRCQSKSSLRTHMRVHTGERPFACNQCTFRSNQSVSLRRHMATHLTTRSFACTQCNKSYQSQMILSDHIRVTHAAMRPFECIECNAKFTRNNQLQRHLSRHTGVPLRQYPCAECGKRFSTSSVRAIHRRKVHISPAQPPHQCDICHERFAYKQQLRRHRAVHVMERPHACDQCDERFVAIELLKAHNETVHTDQRQGLKCDICAKVLKTAAILERHKRTHTGDRPFACNVCQKTFPDSYSVTIHMRIHTGERPYACDICNKKFRDNSNLVKHKKLHLKAKS